MAALLAACLLAALVSEGKAISCQVCQNRTGLSCAGKVTACGSPYDTCIGHYAETTDGGHVVASNFQINCGESKSCNAIYSVNAEGVYTVSGSSCCKTDGCTPVIPLNTTKNRLSCPACFRDNSGACDPQNHTMQCSGLENKCLWYTVETSIGSRSTQVTLRGCATESFCALGNFSSPAIKYRTVCTNSAPHPGDGLLLPAAALLLLMKLHL
ncbi:phospholipase A2 inhibitor and Ly6/PLAUR domain-containing protein-like [Lissotriton helveticus]